MVDWHLLKTSTVCIIALIMGNYAGSGMTRMFTQKKSPRHRKLPRIYTSAMDSHHHQVVSLLHALLGGVELIRRLNYGTPQ